MNAYLVRIDGAQPNAGELVGIFVCKRAELAWHIDQCTDPGTCEYAQIGAGGIYWLRKMPTVPVHEHDEPSWEEIETTAPIFCERWGTAFGEKLKWRRV